MIVLIMLLAVLIGFLRFLSYSDHYPEEGAWNLLRATGVMAGLFIGSVLAILALWGPEVLI